MILLSLTVAGIVSIGAKFGALTLARRIGSDPRIQPIARHLVGVVTAAIGAPALLAVASTPAVSPGAAYTSAAVGTALAARGRVLPVVLVAALFTYTVIAFANPT